MAIEQNISNENNEVPLEPAVRKVSNPVFKVGKLPFVYNLEMLQNVIHNEDFVIDDVFLMSADNETVLWTMIYVTLFGQKQSIFFRTLNAELKYSILAGEAWFTIDNVGIVVESGHFVLVERGHFHKLYNNKKTENLQFCIDFPGKLDLRKYLTSEPQTIE